MSDPPPGLVLMTYSTCRVGGAPAIGPGLNAAAGWAAGDAAATGLATGEAAATGLAAGEAAAAGLAAGEAAAGEGLLSAGFAAAGAEVGAGVAGFGGAGAAPGVHAARRRRVTSAATLDDNPDRFIATRLL